MTSAPLLNGISDQLESTRGLVSFRIVTAMRWIAIGNAVVIRGNRPDPDPGRRKRIQVTSHYSKMIAQRADIDSAFQIG